MQRAWQIASAVIIVLLIDDMITYPDPPLAERGWRKITHRKAESWETASSQPG